MKHPLFIILLQNAIDIFTKSYRYFIKKCNKSLFQNVLGLLLRNVTVLIQNTAVITNALALLQSLTVITKCDVYYKVRETVSKRTFFLSENLGILLDTLGAYPHPTCIFFNFLFFLFYFSFFFCSFFFQEA